MARTTHSSRRRTLRRTVGVAIVRAAALEALAVAVSAGVSWTSQGPVVTTVVASYVGERPGTLIAVCP